MSPSRLPIPNSESSQDSLIPKGTTFSSAALAAGTIAAARQRAGQTVEIRDVQIAGIATSIASEMSRPRVSAPGPAARASDAVTVPGPQPTSSAIPPAGMFNHHPAGWFYDG